jgi:hypothetical protein
VTRRLPLRGRKEGRKEESRKEGRKEKRKKGGRRRETGPLRVRGFVRPVMCCNID